MRRTVIVVVATVAGLVAVLSFHTTPSHLSLGTLPGVSSSRNSPTTSVATGPPPTQSGGGTGPAPAPTSTGASGTPTTVPASTTTVPATTQSATGAAINYNFGVLSVSVTVSGTKITKVDIASLDDGGNFRSQSIDQQSIPILEQQALQAQSANIQGVSGASYTSAGFERSLQAALDQLNFK
jgi:uncharacterized protein with FMN-binding domain